MPPPTFETVGKPEWKVAGRLGPAALSETRSQRSISANVGDFARRPGLQLRSLGARAWAGRYESVLATHGSGQGLPRMGPLRAWTADYAVHIVNKWPDNAVKVVTDRATR
jgi:hypothetical protein